MTSVSAPMACPACASIIDLDDNACPECGVELRVQLWTGPFSSEDAAKVADRLTSQPVSGLSVDLFSVAEQLARGRVRLGTTRPLDVAHARAQLAALGVPVQLELRAAPPPRRVSSATVAPRIEPAPTGNLPRFSVSLGPYAGLGIVAALGLGFFYVLPERSPEPPAPPPAARPAGPTLKPPAPNTPISAPVPPRGPPAGYPSPRALDVLKGGRKIGAPAPSPRPSLFQASLDEYSTAELERMLSKAAVQRSLKRMDDPNGVQTTDWNLGLPLGVSIPKIEAELRRRRSR